MNSQSEIDQATKKNLGKKQQSHPGTGVPKHDKNKQQTKTTKHTIEFSNNKTRHPVSAAQPTRGDSRVLVVRTVVTIRSPDHSLGCRRDLRTNRVTTTRSSYVKVTNESNPLLFGVFGAGPTVGLTV